MALWSTVIQRPGRAAHVVEERIDTRNGGTYLWCDCPGWKFKVNRGGCTHVQMAAQEKEAGRRRVDTPMTDEQKQAIAASEAAVNGGIPVPVNVMLSQKVEAPRGLVSRDGIALDDHKTYRILTRDDLVYEPKWDGHRMVVESRGHTRLWGRAQNDITQKWPELLPDFAGVNAVLDGEVIVLDKDRDHTFAALQNVGSLTPQERSERVRFVVWDVLELDGRDMTRETYENRRLHLEDLDLQMGNRVVLSPASRDGVTTWNAVIEQKLEGIIVKPLSSLYRYGDRGVWKKMKSLQRTDLLIVGYTDGRANDGQDVTPFGALILGEFVDGELRYAGKVGTGFTVKEVERLLDVLAPLRTEDPPWQNRGTVKKVKTHVGNREITWVVPDLQTTVEFQERGKDGVPRFPSYKGLVA